ncbi:hypothetical protein [Aliagarivorans marinus]|uniref:hypothetical protein n=1 Tax=Aliagarivorans marinus TaxID=561965 RepID=UPI0012F82A72|nr:hypothetical protein [Aliagarivorans marinus]
MNTKLKKDIALIPTLMALSLMLPVITWHGIGYSSADAAGWFQRSGSLVVLCSAIMEYVLFKITWAYTPVCGTSKQTTHGRRLPVSPTYLRLIESLKYVTAAIAISGTVIWGYGDLIHLALY